MAFYSPHFFMSHMSWFVQTDDWCINKRNRKGKRIAKSWCFDQIQTLVSTFHSNKAWRWVYLVITVDGPLNQLDIVISETPSFWRFDGTDRQPYRNYGAIVLWWCHCTALIMNVHVRVSIVQRLVRETHMTVHMLFALKGIQEEF